MPESNDFLGTEYIRQAEDEPGEALSAILNAPAVPPQGQAPRSPSPGGKPEMQELPFEAQYPNLYGALGAAKEVGKTILPYVKYIDPEEREKFMQLSQQEQTRDLLYEALNVALLGRWKPIAKFGSEVAGSAFQTFLPKTFDTLTKARAVPGIGMKGMQNVLEPPTPQTVKVPPLPQAAKGSSVPELAKTTETDIIPSVTTPKGTANIPAKITPQAEAGKEYIEIPRKEYSPNNTKEYAVYRQKETAIWDDYNKATEPLFKKQDAAEKAKDWDTVFAIRKEVDTHVNERVRRLAELGEPVSSHIEKINYDRYSTNGIKNYNLENEIDSRDLLKTISSLDGHIGVRGIYKNEIGKKRLKSSSAWDDNSPTSIKLKGTSVLYVGETSGFSTIDDLRQLLNADVSRYGDGGVKAIVFSKKSLNPHEVYNDIGESVFPNAKVIGYIDAPIKTELPNPSRPPEVGGRASATQAATSPTDTPVVEAAKGAADVPPGSTPKPKAEAVPPAAPEAAPVIDVPVVDSDETFKSVKALSEKWDEIIDTQRRGVRPHELAREEAKNIGYTYDEIKNMVPGTTMNDSQVVALANAIKPVADDVLAAAKVGDTQTFMKKFLALAEIDPARWGVRSEGGRTLSIMNEPISGINQYLDQFGNALAAGNITPERLMAMVSKLKTPAQLAELAKAAGRPGFTDAVMEVWINGLLSGPVTQAVNLTGNMIMLGMQPVERGVAAGIGKVLPGQDAVKFREASQMLYGMLEGVKDGVKLGAKALWEGAPQTGSQKIEWKKAITADLFGLDDATGLGKSMNLLGELIRLPGRGLLGMDEFFKGIAGRMELRAMAVREGINNGFEGKDLARFIAEEMNKPSRVTQDAVGQFQKYITFQKDLGKSGQAFQDFVATHPYWKFVFPFVKTPANIFKSFGERTPLALFSRSVRDDIASGGPRRDLALARMSLGSSLSAITASYVADGYITGNGPSDPNLRSALMRTGWQPYSLKIGDTYYSYGRLEPFSTIIGVAASATELINEIDDGDLEGYDIPTAIVSSFAKNVLDKTFTTGAANMILAIENPKQYGPHYARQLGGSVIPSFSAQLTRSLEGDVKEINSMMEAVKARIPGYAADVPSKLNMWGEPIKPSTWGPMFISPIRKSEEVDSPADREIVRNKVSISMPEKQIHGVKLTSQEYVRYVELAGKAAKGPQGLGAKEAIENMIASEGYERQSDGPDGGKALMLRATIYAYRELARKMMLEEFPDLAEKVISQMETRQSARMPNY